MKEGDILVYIQDDGAGITEERLERDPGKLQEPGYSRFIGIYNVNSRLRLFTAKSTDSILTAEKTRERRLFCG